MATREQLLSALQKAHAAGDTAGAQRLAAMLSALPAGAPEAAPSVAVGATSTPAAPAIPQEPRTEDFLRADPDWQAASAIVFEMAKGYAPEGTPEEIAEFGLDEIGWFNTNLASMGMQSATILQATDEQKKAFLYLMDNSEGLAWSLEGVGRLARGIATDPSTYVGISSFGVGSVAAQSGKAMSREGLKLALKTAINMGTRAAIDGAVYGATAEIGRENIRVQGGAQESIDVGKVAQSAGIGAAAGFVLGGAVGAGTQAVATRTANKAIGEAEALFGTGPAANAEPVAPGAALAVDPVAPKVSDLGPAANDIAPAPVQPGLPQNSNILPEPALAPRTVETAAPLPENMAPANDAPSVRSDPNLTGPAKGVETHLNSVIDSIKALAPDGAIRVVDGTQSMKALAAATKGISTMLEAATKVGQGRNLGDVLMQTGITASQLQVLKNSSQQANDTLLREIVTITKAAKTADRKASVALRKQVDELEAARASIQRLDTELSTQSGRDLRMRQEGLNAAEVRGLSVKQLMEEGDLSRTGAENALLFHVAQRENMLQNKVALAALDQRLKIATEAKDFTAIQQLNAERKTILGKVDDQKAPDGSPAGRIYQKFNRVLTGLTEIMISNVFSPSTVIINMVPTYAKILTKPLANHLSTGILDGASLRGMLASYSALHSMTGSAFKAGLLAFKYEKSLLLHNSERVFMDTSTIPKRFGGGIVRFLPRLLNATDEFMSQIAYRSYGVGTATANAVSDAATQGLTGRQADSFIKKAVKEATDRLYSTNPEGDEHIIDMLMDQAQSRGLSGTKANLWVRNELNKNSDLLRQAQSQAGRDYTKDLLFKREFSGKGPGVKGVASKLAKEYEQFVQANPLMKIVGQLFFRTPIRVFEEGLRITPGLNLITPGYMSDLVGKNGPARQTRAQGEAMLAYGVYGSIMSLYATGAITGGGPQDYKQRRQGENTDNYEPYTITMPNGDKWSYRNLDPIATPLKIIVNAMDRIRVLEYRERQGEMADQSEMDKAMAYASAGVGAIAQSIRDASLTQGIDNVWSFFEGFNDPRSGNAGDQGIKALGGFLAMGVPSTWTKGRLEFGGEAFQNDPITLEQILRAKINPQDPLVPRQYTAMGTPRTLANPEAGLYIFNPSRPDERERGKSDAERAIEQDLWVIAQAADTDFTAPYRSEFLPAVSDLRKVNTKDGKETYYDRWQRYIHESALIPALTTIASSELPYGTPGNSPRADAVNNALNAFRKAAIVRLVREEVGGFQGVSDAKVLEGLQRMRSDINVPFN